MCIKEQSVEYLFGNPIVMECDEIVMRFKDFVDKEFSLMVKSFLCPFCGNRINRHIEHLHYAGMCIDGLYCDDKELIGDGE